MLTIAENIFEKQQAVLREVNEITTARIDYNLKMARFFSTASPNVLKAFFIGMKFLSEEATKGLKILPEGPQFEDLRNKLVNSTKDDARFYLYMQKIMGNGDDVNFTIDALHAWFSGQYIVESQNTTVEARNNQGLAQFHEIHFFKSCMVSLESIISDVERRFVDECNFSRGFNPANNRIDFLADMKPNSIVQKSEKLINDFFVLYEQCKEEFGEKWHLEEMVDIDKFDKNRRLFFSIKAYLKTPKEMGSVWLAYRELDEAYVYLQEEQKIFDEYVESLRQDKNRLVADLKSNEAEQPGLVLEKTSKQTEKKVAEPIRTVAKEEKPDDAFSLKIQEYKAKIERERAEKKRLKQTAKQEELRLLEKQKASEAALLARKEERERENAFQLLSGLNTHNFNLIKLILSKPTPHHAIRYAEIEGLFGTGLDGKLPGSITSVSGSHRKISIQQVVGFFDEYESVPEEKSKSSPAEIVGGTFQAHKKGHSAKLPSIAIEMICSPLERSGITTKNIDLFIEAKDALKAQGAAPRP
jgi:hypothetical protein